MCFLMLHAIAPYLDSSILLWFQFVHALKTWLGKNRKMIQKVLQSLYFSGAGPGRKVLHAKSAEVLDFACKQGQHVLKRIHAKSRTLADFACMPGRKVLHAKSRTSADFACRPGRAGPKSLASQIDLIRNSASSLAFLSTQKVCFVSFSVT